MVTNIVRKKPNEEKTRKEVSGFFFLDVGGKNPRELFQGKPTQSGRDRNPIHIVPLISV